MCVRGNIVLPFILVCACASSLWSRGQLVGSDLSFYLVDSRHQTRPSCLPADSIPALHLAGPHVASLCMPRKLIFMAISWTVCNFDLGLSKSFAKLLVGHFDVFWLQSFVRPDILQIFPSSWCLPFIRIFIFCEAHYVKAICMCLMHFENYGIFA